jgi:peroxiredoxin
MAQQSSPIPSSPKEVCPLMPGTSVPAVTVRAIDGSEVSLADAIREKPAILVFYRGAW